MATHSIFSYTFYFFFLYFIKTFKILKQNDIYVQAFSFPASTNFSYTTKLLSSATASDLARDIRDYFPMLKQNEKDNPQIYFDNAATSFKPYEVIEAMNNYYTKYTSNIHRSTHHLSLRATEAYESARDCIAQFINANRNEIVFTSGATEAINLISHSYGMNKINQGDEIILSIAEHHSNLIPWQILAKKKSAFLKYIKLNSEGTIDLDHFRSLISSKTKIVAITHSSNVLGYLTPIEEIIKLAHAKNAVVVLDACQSIPNRKVDVKAINCDFLVCSGHKMCGPTSIGFLYGKYELLDKMEPYQYGGEMIEEVFLDNSVFTSPPTKFEAGTPHIAEAIGLGSAVKFLTEIGLDNIERYEENLGLYLYNKLSNLPDIEIYGPRPSSRIKRNSLVSFNHNSLHPYDIAAFMDQNCVAIRAGHHCAQPLHNNGLKKSGSVRASPYIYNTYEEIDCFILKLKKVLKLLESYKNST